jgi:phosphoribosyl 1,2-cyclic phosphodiesterase
MSLFIASLNSGSNGNCYYIGNHDEAILVDAGISCRETLIRMKRAGLEINKVKAIVVSHEHADHISGIEVLSKKFSIPVLITTPTLQQSKLKIDRSLVRHFCAYEAFQIGNLTVTPFPKFHDAKDPHSFIIEYNNVRVGVFTDIGKPCENVVHYFGQCHAAFLEANYDEDMLFSGNYPYHLKKRISDGFGHLSNVQALQLYKNHGPANMSHVLLSHLSKNNNTPEIALNLFTDVKENTNVVVASRYKETEVFHVTGVRLNKSVTSTPVKQSRTQLTMF